MQCFDPLWTRKNARANRIKEMCNSNSGTSRDYYGIELYYSHLSSTHNCSKEFYCPYGTIDEVSYSTFESIEQDQEYPELHCVYATEHKGLQQLHNAIFTKMESLPEELCHTACQ
ncbi:hypothetical protein I4U23_004522 [Adineta vaga]|nr:hypothetical protein I4U23_004522 [Adineta vaga]